MNKKVIILIAIAVFVLFIIVVRGCGGTKSAKLNQVAHANPDLTVNQPKAVDIYIDASGSMKGYVDGVTGTFKTNIPGLATSLMNHNTLALPADSIRCFTIRNGNPQQYDTKVFCDDLSNTRLFNGQSTEVHTMFDLVADRVLADPSHVAVLVSDCILSFPKCKNTDKNIVDIALLQNNVTRSMTRLVNNDLSVAIVQYMSDFNGNYYFNYRDNLLSSARGQVMHQRPYYLILVGAKNKIESLFNKEVLPKDYTGIYMFNRDCTQPDAHFIRAQRSGVVSSVKDNIPEIRVDAKGEPAYFYVAVEDFYIPSFVDPGTMSHPQFNGSIIASVEPVSFNVLRDDNQCPANETVNFTYLYRVTLKPNEQLRDIAELSDEIYFVSESLDIQGSEIINDNVENISELEGKTFMFAHFIDAINKAYVTEKSKVAAVKVQISKFSNKN